jgi:hypothetical protein
MMPATRQLTSDIAIRARLYAAYSIRMPTTRQLTSGIAIVWVIVATGCGQASHTPEGTGHTATTSAPTGSTEDPQLHDLYLNWDDPNGGVLVDSFPAAQKSVSFTVLVPQGIGNPTSIYANNPDSSTDIVTAVYDSPDYGRVIVEQETSHLTEEQWSADSNQVISLNGTPGEFGTAYWVDIGGGVSAFGTTTQDRTQSTLAWLRDGGTVELDILGPSLSADQAKAIATGLGSTTTQTAN